MSTKTAAPAHRAATAATTPVETAIVTLSEADGELVNEWKEWRLIRIEAEKAEKAAKAAMLDKIGTKPNKGLNVFVQVGTKVVAKLGWVTKGGLNQDTLKDAYPEAFEAAWEDDLTQYPLVNPA